MRRLLAAVVAGALCTGPAAAQPFSGTVFMSPNVITSADPTSLTEVRYVGRGERVIYDRRYDSWVTVNAYLFQVRYEQASRTPAPGQTAGQIEFQVNPEFGSPEAAQLEVETFARALGRLPLFVVARLADIHVNDGDELFGAGVSGGAHSITIHTVYGRRMLRDGFLEEVLFHEGAHSLDGQHADSAGWRAAQEADDAFISTYAATNPNREDIAESLLPYFAVRVVPGRLGSRDRDAIEATIPNRIAYFEAQGFDWSPYGPAVVVPVLPGAGVLGLAALLISAGVHRRRRSMAPPRAMSTSVVPAPHRASTPSCEGDGPGGS
ncbi:MAG: hypothetical protein OXG35_00395 [Acidobacteria bacterium]|nr:hypothetical protein [Acidobacteriota bacterium]